MQGDSAGRAAFILGTDTVQRAQCADIGRNIGIADRSSADQVLRAITRSAIGIDDDRSRPRETLQQPCTHRLYDLSHRLTMVVGGHSDQNVHLANIDQLTDEVIRKYACFGQK